MKNIPLMRGAKTQKYTDVLVNIFALRQYIDSMTPLNSVFSYQLQYLLKGI
ncbi:MAG: hypothetical protein ACI9O6_001002 [Glaciecola sp.]